MIWRSRDELFAEDYSPSPYSAGSTPQKHIDWLINSQILDRWASDKRSPHNPSPVTARPS